MIQNIKENFFIILVIALVLGNTFMSWRNYEIAKQADQIAFQEVAIFNGVGVNTVLTDALNNDSAYIYALGETGIGPTMAQLSAKLNTLNTTPAK